MPFQFRSLTNGYLKISEKLRLQKNFLSAGIKLLYAFFWQENVISNPLVFDPTLNSFGADIPRFVNRFANELNSFVYYEQNFQVRSAFLRVAECKLDSSSDETIAGWQKGISWWYLVSAPTGTFQMACTIGSWPPGPGLLGWWDQ